MAHVPVAATMSSVEVKAHGGPAEDAACAGSTSRPLGSRQRGEARTFSTSGRTRPWFQGRGRGSVCIKLELKLEGTEASEAASSVSPGRPDRSIERPCRSTSGCWDGVLRPCDLGGWGVPVQVHGEVGRAAE